MNYEQIKYEVAKGVATIILNRPDRLNAWTGQMHFEVKQAMRDASDNEEVRVILLTGEGRGFCAGADMDALSSIQSNAAESTARHEDLPFDANAPEHFKKTYSYFPSVPKPIIAAINGPCAGLGFVISLYCDVRFAAHSAVFTTAFSKRGLIAEHGISWLLPRLVGAGRAFDLLFSARKVRAAEAYNIGLVEQVFEDKDFRSEAIKYAQELATNVSPRSLREMKREVWAALFQDLGQAIESANEDMRKSFASEDFKEGVSHFVERRQAAFTGR